MDYPFSETSPGVSKQDMRSLADWIRQTAIDQQQHIESQTQQIDAAIKHFNDRADGFVADSFETNRKLRDLRIAVNCLLAADFIMAFILVYHCLS